MPIVTYSDAAQSDAGVIDFNRHLCRFRIQSIPDKFREGSRVAGDCQLLYEVFLGLDLKNLVFAHGLS